jgi:hypothetical protein
MQDDEFSRLPQGEYDGVVFPCGPVQITSGGAAARHKFPHRPGQKLEHTGREPLMGTITAPMFRDLRLEGGGRNVYWPDGVALLREKAQTQKSAKLVIPVYGTLEKAKITITESYDPVRRDGCMVMIAFEEDSTDIIAKGTAPTAASKLPDLASGVDDQLAALAFAAKQRIEDLQGGSHIDFVSAISAFLAMKDQTEASILNRLTYANRVIAALDDVLSTARGTLSDPVGWEARYAILDLKLTLADAATEGTAAARQVKSFTVAKVSTAAEIALATGNTVTEIIALNGLPDPNDIAVGEILYVYVKS